MHDVAEHDCKEEWEGDRAEERGVGLFVLGHAVGVDDQLGHLGEVSGLVERGGRQLGVHGALTNLTVDVLFTHRFLEICELGIAICWNPHQADQVVSAVFKHAKRARDNFLLVDEHLINRHVADVVVPSVVLEVVEQLLLGNMDELSHLMFVSLGCC